MPHSFHFLSHQPPIYRPSGFEARIIGQTQRDIALFRKAFTHEIPLVADMAIGIPNITPLLGNTLEPVVDAVTAVQLNPLNDIQIALEAQSQILTSVQTATEGLSALANLEIFNPPGLTFPAMHIIEPFLSIPSFSIETSWLTTINDQVNALFTALPTWPSLDLKRLEEKIKQRLLLAFSKARLCFAPSMSEALMYQIADILETCGKQSSIILLVWNYYARHNYARLQHAVERWQDNQEYARRWKSILFPAFQAHTRGEYGLSISALAPLVEGISSHVVKRNELLPINTRKSKRGKLDLGATESVIVRTLKTVGDEAHLESDTTELAHWVRVKSALEFAEGVFCEKLQFEQDYDHIHNRNREVHRHGLLHGIQINAMTAFNSLRLFLLLDTMHDLLQAYIAKGGIV